MNRKFELLSSLVLVAVIVVGSFAVAVGSTSACDDDCSCEPGTVFYLGKDALTQGNWTDAKASPIGKYGSYAHILPNAPVTRTEIVLGSFSVPLGDYDPEDLLGPPFNWTANQVTGLQYHMLNPPYWDEYVSRYPMINYSLTGSLYNGIQYPAFEWVWDERYDSSYQFDSFGQVWNTTDPRACWFNTTVIRNDTWIGGPGTRLTAWDDGSERGFPSDGYFNVTMEFPDGLFMLSLYAYDYEREIRGQDWRPSQMIYVTDLSGNILASGVMAGEEFDEGIYLQFLVCGPAEIIVNIVKDADSINAALSGIFVDKVEIEKICGLTIGFWGTNAAKNLRVMQGRAQISKTDYLSLLRCVDSVYGGLIEDWAEWGIGDPLHPDDALEYALHWLSYGRYKPRNGPGTGFWGRPIANDPQVKARGQLLALLLTACYKGSAYVDAWISIPEYDGWQKVSDLISHIILEYNENNYGIVYYMANYLNENCAWALYDP